ncbi:unnamed protein product [Ambrosiozyma monospora]|uniref:Unnamed protein product n=1 Tax=Ambrosiozyma monospora TaxID=43982 RepID=A0A9W7DEQ7_AMBMO|nr:unnamed protein product [Ambrosiozyma monospora]
MGSLTKSDMSFNKDILNIDTFVSLLLAIKENKLTKNNAKLLLMHLVNNPEDQQVELNQLLEDFNLEKDTLDENEIQKFIDQVIQDNQNVVSQIVKKGKVKKLNYLIGQCMRLSEGKIEPLEFEKRLQDKLNL